MKFKAQHGLVKELIKRVSGVIQGSNSHSDMGRYVVLKAAGSKVGATVAREDILASVTLDASAVGDDDLLAVDGDGSYAVSGEHLARAVVNTEVGGAVEMEFEAGGQDGFVQDEDSDEESELQAVGAIRGSMDGLNGSREKFWLQCVDLPVPHAMEPDKNTAVAIQGSDFIKYVQQVGVAAGKPNLDVIQSHMLIRTDQKDSSKLEMVTYDGYRFAWAKAPGCDGNSVKGIVQHDLVLAISKMLDPEEKVMICSPKSGPAGLIIAQGVRFGQDVVGKAVYRIYSRSDKFGAFEKAARSLDLKFKCKARTQFLKHISRRLSVVKESHTRVSYRPSEEVIRFSKTSASARNADVELPITACEGGDLDLSVSSRFLSNVFDMCDLDEVEIGFSGKRSLFRIVVSPTFRVYIQPYTNC